MSREKCNITLRESSSGMLPIDAELDKFDDILIVCGYQVKSHY